MVISSLHIHGYNRLQVRHGYLGYKWLFMLQQAIQGTHGYKLYLKLQ